MRALIAEQDSDARELLRACASAEGYEAVVCTDFEEARAQLLTRRPDVLLTGIRLGAFNGLHLALLARHTYPTISILVFSPYEDPVLRQEAARCDAFYLVTPVTIEDLRNMLRRPTAGNGQNIFH